MPRTMRWRSQRSPAISNRNPRVVPLIPSPVRRRTSLGPVVRPKLVQLHRQRDPIDQDHGVDLHPARVLVGGAGLKAVLRDEVVVVADEQKVIVWISRVE